MSDIDTGMLSPTIDVDEVIGLHENHGDVNSYTQEVISDLGNESVESGNSGSTDSSFVPIETAVVDAIQVVNEDKKFNQHLIEYIENTTPISAIENNYHIISVFGSQSTGKSTLLNKLFNTNFDVMDETRRQQTTKGIWLAYSPAVNSKAVKKGHTSENIFVMDVEGTDGRERGEDQDFERKSALFALSTSEVLIINIWETQIGLYQGANMGLLKTVFEVNLSLFGKNKLKNKSDNHKVLLLFVIRDHIGVTPVENLATTVTTDLVKMWDGLNKPAELDVFKFDDFFDVKFHALGHKILQAEKFDEDVRLLGDKLLDKSNPDYCWKPNYHHDLPIDGWTMYANNCWEQIDSNKDLDLPTQQILVAKFKCDEIVSNLYEEFLVKYQELLVKPELSLEKSCDEDSFKDIGLLMRDLKGEVLDQFDLLASKYNQSVYEQKRSTLNEKVVSKYTELFGSYTKKLNTFFVKEFQTSITAETDDDEKFVDKINKLKLTTVSKFSAILALLSIEEINFDTHVAQFIEELDQSITKQQGIELNNIITKMAKRLTGQLNKYITFELNDFNESSWDNILKKFEELVEKLLAPYKESGDSIDFGLGIGKDLTNESVKKFKFKSWSKFYGLIQKNFSKGSILNMLKDKFEDNFRYDENGVPRLYSNEFELDDSYNKAKSATFKLVPLLTMVKLSNSSEIIPEYDIFNESLRKKYDEPSLVKDDDDEFDAADDLDELDSNRFSHIMSENEKADMLSKFKREVDARYIETKRSIVQQVSSIPYYIYLIIVVLGWNEFMAVIRSPIFFTLALLLGGLTYVMYQLNLIKPAMQVGNKMLQESIALGKEKLKEFLIDDNEFHRRNLNKVSNTKEEEIEMDDLSQ